jgi:uncharacterized membrane protein YfcA
MLIFLCLLAFIAGMARGFSGFGAALIFVPLAASVIGPQQASPLLLITDSIMALPLIYSAWGKARKTQVALMALGGCAGVPVGTWILTHGDATQLRWLIAGLTAAMLALLLSVWRYTGQPKPPATIAVGAVSGLFSGLAQIGGPPAVAYWLGGKERADIMRASTIMFFAVGSATSLVNYYVSGLLTMPVTKLSLMILPFFGAGLFIGTRMFSLASETTFRRICLCLIAVSLLTSLPLWR